jgi:hypothetical protein
LPRGGRIIWVHSSPAIAAQRSPNSGPLAVRDYLIDAMPRWRFLPLCSPSASPNGGAQSQCGAPSFLVQADRPFVG